MRQKPATSKNGPQSGGPAVSDACELTLSEEELDLLVDVFETLLNEHLPRTKHADYNLELHVAPRGEVEAMLIKLRAVRQKQIA